MEAVKESTVTAQNVERKVEPINAANIKEAEFVRSVHAATIPINTNANDLLNPAYWAHVANQLKPWGKVEARALDGTWYAEYIVLDVGRTWAKLHMLSQHNLTNEDVSLTQANAQTPFDVKWRGPNAKWSVVRRVDGSVMDEGKESKESAQEWLNKHISGK